MSFAIGIHHMVHDCNLAGLMRSAYCLGASFVYTIGREYKRSAADTVNCTERIPYYNYLNFEQFLLNSPKGYQVVAVENPIDAKPLETFCHPRKAIYLLGSEAGGLPKKILDLIPLVVKIDSAECLNVCTAGSIVMYDRNSKIIQKRMSGI